MKTESKTYQFDEVFESEFNEFRLIAKVTMNILYSFFHVLFRSLLKDSMA